jgi:hypothetical protein
MPLLQGGVHFTDAKVGRADIRIPVSPDGRWQLPPDLAPGSPGRTWAIENLVVGQLLINTEVTSTGRTDQFFAENVAIDGQKLTGPWRLEGTTVGVPFRLVTGELGEDRTVPLKLSGGGDIYPRFDIDAKLDLGGGGTGSEAASLSGRAKVLFGPPAQVAAAGIPIPVTIDAGFKTRGPAVELDAITLEAGEGGASLRVTGSGSIRADEPRIALKLEGRRLDADSFILSSNGQDFMSRLNAWSIPTSAIPIDLDLALNSIGLAQEELTNAVVKATIVKGRAQVELMEFTAPGETRVAVQGEVGLSLQGGASGRVALASKASDRLARYLGRLRVQGPFLQVLDGRPFEAASDFAVALPVTSFRNLRVKAADATLTGNLRFTAPEGDARGKLEAQVAVQGLNLDQLPQVSSVFDATQNLDVGFIFDARDVRAGNQRGGRVSARILSDGPALLVEALDIVDLAGANAKVSGRIAPDGSGRIAGKVTAQRAAPLVDLLGSVWIGGVSKLVPVFLREGDLNLDVVTERAVQAGGTPALRLRTTAKGTAAGGGFDGTVLTVDGATENLDVRIATDNTGRWVGKPDLPLLRRPSNLTLQGTRVTSGQFSVVVAGDVGGVRLSTTRPFGLSATEDVVDSGEAEISTADITPFLALLGDGAGVNPPVPLQTRVTLGRERDASLLTIAGRAADNPFQARLAVRSRAEVTGTVTLDRLSLPWLVTSFALNAPADPNANAIWSTVRFGQTNRLLTGAQVAFTTGRLDFGRGLIGQNAGFTAVVTPEGLSVRELQTDFAGGKLTAGIAVTRQGSLASMTGEGAVRDVALSALSGKGPFDARLSGSIKFGAAAETFAGLVSNLGGAGDLRVTELQVPNADPGALDRALQRLLADSDPLAARRAETIVADELGRGPLRAAAVSAPVALVGGAFRLSPFIADGGAAAWQGSVSYDFKSLALDARGTLTAKNAPTGWTGTAPSVGLSWRGPLTAPTREIDPGALSNGLAAIVLQRELEKIESFEADANERLRRQQRRDLDRQRERDRVAAEEAARQAKLREEQARLRAEADRTRIDAERLQSEQRRASEDQQASPTSLPALPPPIDIRPPPQVQTRPGG